MSGIFCSTIKLNNGPAVTNKELAEVGGRTKQLPMKVKISTVVFHNSTFEHGHLFFGSMCVGGGCNTLA